MESYKHNPHSLISQGSSGETDSVYNEAQLDKNGEPWERNELPWLKDPNTKMSLWSVVKDSMGQDLSKITLPVYFNDPTSTLQKNAQSHEYTYILDLAASEEDPMRRIALLACYYITCQTVAEKSLTKPFNPLLGETYEMSNEHFDFIAE